MTLTAIGPRYGPIMVAAALQQARFNHPSKGNYGRGDRMDMLEGAIPVFLAAGDTLLFIDGLMHCSSNGTNAGERRNIIYR